MTSVIEHVNGAGGGFDTAYVIAMATTPITATDTVIVRVTQTRDGVSGTSVTGLGATWAKVARTADTDQDIQVWRGTGATTSGNATINFNGSTWAQASLTLVRGLASSAVHYLVTSANASGANTSAFILATPGQFVLATGYSPVLTAYVGSTPASGWTNAALVTTATTIVGHSHLVPTNRETCIATATNSGSTAGQQMVVVFGSYRDDGAAYINEHIGVPLPTTTVINRRAVGFGVTPIKTETLTKVGTGEAVAYINENITT